MNDITDPPSPFAQHLGYELVAWREDYARYEMPIRPFLENRQGIPHGGAIATLLDSTMGLCGLWSGDAAERRMGLTLSLNVQYIGQAKGSKLICEARRTGGGRTTFFAEGEITDDTGQLVAKGTGVFRHRRS
jgi:uncharacterized protein (TIGR00369 family)